MPPYAMWLLKEVKKETITRSCAVMIDLLAEKTVGYSFLYYLNWPMRSCYLFFQGVNKAIFNLVSKVSRDCLGFCLIFLRDWSKTPA